MKHAELRHKIESLFASKDFDGLEVLAKSLGPSDNEKAKVILAKLILNSRGGSVKPASSWDMDHLVRIYGGGEPHEH